LELEQVLEISATLQAQLKIGAGLKSEKLKFRLFSLWALLA